MAAKTVRSKSRAAKSSVLLIDKSMQAAQKLQRELEAAGYEVKVLVGNYIELDENLWSFPFNNYDVVVCEYNLGAHERTIIGIQILCGVRELFPKHKLILMSAETGVVTIAYYQGLGFFGREGVTYSIVDVVESILQK